MGLDDLIKKHDLHAKHCEDCTGHDFNCADVWVKRAYSETCEYYLLYKENNYGKIRKDYSTS